MVKPALQLTFKVAMLALIAAEFAACLMSLGLTIIGKIRVAALVDAAAAGDTRRVRGYLREGVNVNGTGLNGESAIQMACYFGRGDVVKLLIDHGASATIGLTWASHYGNPGIVRLLLDHGANPNPLFHTPTDSPLARAEASGNRQVIDMLKRAGARVYYASPSVPRPSAP